MRTIIVSDITETSESIIPYGLNVGKHTETRVNILHYLDPSIIQGTYSPFSDSQSITPGEKLSHEEVLNREKGIINEVISHLLSREASVLNYPLRINTIAEIGEIESFLFEQMKNQENPLFITGTKPGRSMAVDLQELLLILHEFNVKILIIPPGKKFVKPNRGCLVTDLLAEGNDKIQELFQWINPLVSKVSTSAVVNTDLKINHDQKTEDWKAALKPYADKVNISSLETIYIDDMNIAFESICDRKNPDIAILPKNKNSYFAEYLFADNNVKKLAEMINIPILLY